MMSNWTYPSRPPELRLQPSLRVQDRFSAEDFPALLHLYRCAGAPRPPDEAALRWLLSESDLAVALRGSEPEGLVAFARVLTDFSREAVVLDVLADPCSFHPAETLRAAAVAAVVEHPLLREVASIEVRPPLRPKGPFRVPVRSRVRRRRRPFPRLVFTPAV
jgi:hypothetical protein